MIHNLLFKSPLSKTLIFAIIVIGVLFTLGLPNTVLASTVRDFGFTDPSEETQKEVLEACKKYIKDEVTNDLDAKVTNDIQFSSCLASARAGALKSPPTDEEGAVAGMIINVVNWVMRIIGALAVAFIVYGGITYITSGGDEKKVAQAKNILLYAIIGFVISVLAQVILWMVTKAIEG